MSQDICTRRRTPCFSTWIIWSISNVMHIS